MPQAVFLAAMFAVTVGWAIYQPYALESSSKEQVHAHASSLAHSVSMLVSERASAGDASIARALESKLLLKPPIRFATLERDGQTVAYVGHPSPRMRGGGPFYDSEPHVFVFEMDRRQGCSKPRRPPRRGLPTTAGPRTPWSWCDASPKTDLVLRVGADKGMSPEMHQRMDRDVAFTLALVWLASIVFAWGWYRHSRSRVLMRVLTREHAKREMLEEQMLAAAGLAHETKNPLGIILGLSQRLAGREDAPEFAREIAEHITDEADRASSRLSDFLNFSSISAPTLEPHDVTALCGDLTDILAYDFEYAGVALETALEPCVVSCDARMFEQVLTNLLLNSLNASEPGSTTRVRFDATGAKGTLEVSDEGCGIDADFLAHVFEPYRSGTPGGHGLGLAVVKRVCTQHAWSLDVRSAPGIGTTFTIGGIDVIENQESE